MKRVAIYVAVGLVAALALWWGVPRAVNRWIVQPRLAAAKADAERQVALEQDRVRELQKVTSQLAGKLALAQTKEADAIKKANAAVTKANNAEERARRLQGQLADSEAELARIRAEVVIVPESELRPRIRRALAGLCARGSIPSPCPGAPAQPR